MRASSSLRNPTTRRARHRRMDPLVQHLEAPPGCRHENPYYGVCFNSLTCAENGASLRTDRMPQRDSTQQNSPFSSTHRLNFRKAGRKNMLRNPSHIPCRSGLPHQSGHLINHEVWQWNNTALRRAQSSTMPTHDTLLMLPCKDDDRKIALAFESRHWINR